ncbi:MAG: sigma-54-dependent Fis family transcriptional regulator [Ignavibacteriae bacterium]|nr:sigma-54-dependent Fis family transcriptional regulator [Ignavibacteriota bacterium]NOG97357.1 sigma-54-dependent Fis family transcriptional regulator [Ignavibacteriota bacterium]
MNAKIIIIDDEKSFRDTLSLYLVNLGYSVTSAENGKVGLKLIEKEIPNLVICDLRMPGLNGIEVLERIKNIDQNIQVILLTAFDNISSTIAAMQKGAYDYIQKPVDFEQLKIRAARAIENQSLSLRLSAYITEESDGFQIEKNLVGKSANMREIFKYIGQLSLNKVTVLVEGESGTGKELIAKIIHYTGVTKDQPFIAVNCTALTESLLESELFGHVRGAFTGASANKKGKFELAGEGTIFLDEISEISKKTQVKLLRILQEKEFEKVGGEFTIPMRARIIAATNRNLQDLVTEGKFREDLYYRLQVFTIFVPPLRDRKNDIPFITIHLLKKINAELHKNVNKVPFEVMEMLQEYNWVGNVRELENTLMQAVVLSKGDVLEKEAILLGKKSGSRKSKVDESKLSLAEVEKKQIKIVLDKVNWNKQKACRILGITKPTLYQKLSKYDLTKPDYK